MLPFCGAHLQMPLQPRLPLQGSRSAASEPPAVTAALVIYLHLSALESSCGLYPCKVQAHAGTVSRAISLGGLSNRKLDVSRVWPDILTRRGPDG